MLDRPAETPGTSAAPPRRRQDQSAPALGVRMMLTILRRRKWPLLGCMIFIPLAAWIALQQLTPRYTASGTLIYDPSEYKVRELQSILRADPTTEAVMASQAEILHSLRVAQRVAERGNLYDRPEFNRALLRPNVLHQWMETIRWLLGMEYEETTAEPPPGPRPDAERNATLVAVRDALHAGALRFSHVIEVTFTAEDPIVAAAAVNNAMDVYIKDQFAAKARAVHRATELLEKRAGGSACEISCASGVSTAACWAVCCIRSNTACNCARAASASRTSAFNGICATAL